MPTHRVKWSDIKAKDCDSDGCRGIFQCRKCGVKVHVTDLSKGSAMFLGHRCMPKGGEKKHFFARIIIRDLMGNIVTTQDMNLQEEQQYRWNPGKPPPMLVIGSVDIVVKEIFGADSD